MPHRDFDAERAKGQPVVDPITFTLGGETLRVAEKIGAGAMLRWARIEDIDKGSDVQAIEEIVAIVRSCVAQEDWPALDRALEVNGPLAVDLMTLVDVIPWLMEQITNRPTQRPSSSSGGPKANGARSKGRSSSQAAKPKRSPAATRAR